MIQMYYIVSILLSIPLMLSIASFLWGKYHNDEDNFPGTLQTHLILVVAQTVAITVLFVYQSSLSFIPISIMYFIQSIGVVYLRLKKGNVSCGCLGSQSNSKLSYKLVFYNLCLGVIGILAINLINISNNYFMLSGLFLEFALLILALFIVIGVPDAIYTIKGYSTIAEKYHSKILKRNGAN